MNKSDLIDAIARHADISKAAAGRALDALTGAITGALAEGRLGDARRASARSTSGQRTARQGRNPQTGAAVPIPAAKVPKFRAGKALKDAVN